MWDSMMIASMAQWFIKAEKHCLNGTEHSAESKAVIGYVFGEDGLAQMDAMRGSCTVMLDYVCPEMFFSPSE
jgi:hypothetical protein